MNTTTNPTTAPAVIDTAFAVTGKGNKVRRRVSAALLKFPDGSTLTCRIVTAIHMGKELTETKKGPITKPAEVCMIEAANGEVRTLVVGEVLKRELTEAYPENSYVGLWFEITKYPPRTDKNYSDYSVAEIERPEGARTEGKVYSPEAA